MQDIPQRRNSQKSVAICSNLWQSATISGNLQKSVGIFRHLQQYVEILIRDIQLSLAICSILQQSVAIFYNICSNLYLRLSAAITKNLSQCFFYLLLDDLNTLSTYCPFSAAYAVLDQTVLFWTILDYIGIDSTLPDYSGL